MTRRRRIRGNGEGSVYRVKPRPGGKPRKLQWAAVLVTGYNIDGSPVRRSLFASSEAAAKLLLAEMRRARDGGDPMPDLQLTVAAYLVRWLELAAGHVRAGTLRSYRFNVEHLLLPSLGAIKLRSLRASHVTTILDGLTGVSPHTVAGARAVLRRALADAERDRLIDHNPAALARLHHELPGQKPAPAIDDVRAVLHELEAHRLSALFVLLAHTGLRIGEATGLRWGDVDGETLTVRVQLQSTRNPDEPFVLAEPKTPRSRRTMTLAPAAVEALRTHKLRQAQERLAAGSGWRDRSDLVFTRNDGWPLHPSTITWLLNQACERAKVAHLATHDFRRLAATIVTATGDLKAAQGLLGHKSEHMTADRYASLSDAARRRAAAAMEEAISGG
ncbi:MAG: tyrosine-type recombinase/integrase [Candidatus Limnocylindrales bacterium]